MTDASTVKFCATKNNSITFACFEYIKKHPLYAVVSAFTVVLAYGFYATHYTFNLDQLVPQYYDGNLLVTAGRWAAPLIHVFTNWMDFSPFWHTILMMLLLWLSGLCWIVLFNRAADGSISGKALFSFWLIYPVFPMIAAQLTYPILNIALAYVLVPVALWLLYPMWFEKKKSLRNLLAAFILILMSVDMYESFAPVFLTGVAAILILKYLFIKNDNDNTLKYILTIYIKSAVFLAAIIITDFCVSKIVCFISSGSFEFWYVTNTTIQWFDYDNIIDAVIWFLRDLLAKYVIAGAENLSVLLFVFSVMAVIIAAVVLCIKNHSAVPILLFSSLPLYSLSLAFVVGYAPAYRMAQAIPVFVAFMWMLFVHYSCDKKYLTLVSSVLTVLLILNQSQAINNYAVRNYEIFEYGYSRMREIGDELENYDSSEKHIVFIRNDDAVIYPEALCTPELSDNPLYAAFRKTACTFWDKVLPEHYYTSMDGVIFSEANIKITDCNSLLLAEKSKMIIYTPYMNTLLYAPKCKRDGYEAMRRMGYDYVLCTEDEYNEAKSYLIPDDDTVRFKITETDTMIIVQIMAVD